MRRLQRRLGGHRDVGLYARAFPVGIGNRIDGAPARNEDREAVRQGDDVAGVRAAAGRFADDDRALARLQIVRELLGGRKRAPAGQHVDGLGGAELGSLHAWIGKEIVSAIGHAPIERIEMNGFRAEQIAAHESDRFGLAASVVADIEDDRRCIGGRVHRLADLVARLFAGDAEGGNVDIGDVSIEPSRRPENPRLVGIRRGGRRAGFSSGARRASRATHLDAQVLVVRYALHVLRERPREREPARQTGVGVLAQARVELAIRCGRLLRENVGAVQFAHQPLHDLYARLVLEWCRGRTLVGIGWRARRPEQDGLNRVRWIGLDTEQEAMPAFRPLGAHHRDHVRRGRVFYVVELESTRPFGHCQILRHALLGVLRSAPETADPLAIGGVDGRHPGRKLLTHHVARQRRLRLRLRTFRRTLGGRGRIDAAGGASAPRRQRQCDGQR